MHKLRNASHLSRKALSKSKARGDSYRKAQYISAYIEAESDRMMQAAAVRRSYTAMPVPSTPPELRQLAETLEKKYGTGRQRRPSTATRSSSLTVVTADSETVPTTSTHSFGVWRRADEKEEKRAASADFVHHRVIREGTTPAQWSPVSLGRRFDSTPSAQRFHTFIKKVAAPSKAKPHAAALISIEKIMTEIERCCVEVAGGSGRHAPDTALASLMRCYCLQHVCRRLGWSIGLVCVTRRHTNGEVRSQTSFSKHAAVTEASEDLAVLCECVRYERTGTAGPSRQGPTVKEMAEILQSLSSLLLQDGAAVSDAAPQSESLVANGRSTFLPVLAAPLLACLVPSSTHDDRETELRLLRHIAEKYLIAKERSRQGHPERRYLPAIAWAEYVKAYHRFGASQAEVEALIDGITDDNVTHNADALMRSPLLWSAYLFCCDDGDKALEVYRVNLPHYGVEPLPCVTAAVMASLARSPLAKHQEAVLTLWSELRAQETRYVIGSTTVFLALCDVYKALHRPVELCRLIVDFNACLVYFGVSYDWWETEGGAELLAAVSRVGEAPSDCIPYQQFFKRVCTNYHDEIPPILREQIRSLFDHFVTPSKVAESSSEPALTAEVLEDLLT